MFKISKFTDGEIEFMEKGIYLVEDKFKNYFNEASAEIFQNKKYIAELAHDLKIIRSAKKKLIERSLNIVEKEKIKKNKTHKL